jgi:hypothetical protein
MAAAVHGRADIVSALLSNGVSLMLPSGWPAAFQCLWRHDPWLSS